MSRPPSDAPGGRLIAPWRSGYRRGWLTGDLVAGLVAACVVVPQAVAYAGVAGLPVQVGLYAALVPMFVYAMLGTSRVLSVSVTSTLSILTASAIAISGGGPEAAALLALMSGALLVVAGLLRVGFLADLVSLPILAGFKAGTGLVLISGQLGKVLGVPIDGDGFFANIADAVRGLDDVDGVTLALAAATIAVIVAMRRWARRVPGPLVAVVGGILAVGALGLADDGLAVVGAVPSGLPGFAVPPLEDWRLLVPGAAGVALMATVESVAAGRALAARADPPVDTDRELVALGCANVGAGLFHAYPAGGGLSQSAVNRDAGARTQVSALATVAVVALVLTVMTGLLENLAEATLGALVIVAAFGLVQPAELRRIVHVRVRDGVLALVALAAVLVLGVLAGVLVAIVVSMATLLAQAYRSPVDVISLDEQGRFRRRALGGHDATPPGLLMLRPRGILYFANVRRVGDQVIAAVDRAMPVEVVVVDLSAVPDLEVTALTVMADIRRELRERGIETWITGLDGGQREMAARFGIDDRILVFPTLDAAVSAHRSARSPGSG
jgi:high affinity sulfate transporter 1